MIYSAEKPCIILYCSDDTENRMPVREILLGAEEEGVPVRVISGEYEDIRKLAWDAAMQSILEVGIGAGESGAVLQFKKLPPEKPVCTVSRNASLSEYRRLGANAARLVKKMPLCGIG